MEIHRRIDDFIAKIVKKNVECDSAFRTEKKQQRPFFLLYRVVGEMHRA